MDWNDWQKILRWRAIEEGDADGALLSEERRREATGHKRAGLTSELVKNDPAGPREVAFLLRRACWLEQEVVGCNGSLVRLIERLTVVTGRRSWIIMGWLAAGITGYAMAGFGQEAEFNLLALPLVGLLAWNLIIMLLAVVMEFQKEARSPMLEWLALRVTPQTGERASFDADPPTGLTVDQRFAMLASAPAFERWQRRFRAWLHIAAALMALGSAVGLYARGWSKEYRAVWESTLLSEAPQAQSFFGTLFQPASAALHLPLPLDQLPAMHRTGGVASAPAPASPWIHLYAGTLLVLVILPRALLAGLTVWRAHHILAQRMLALGWQSYLVRTLRMVEGGQEIISVLVHGTDATPMHREVWLRGVRERFGRMTEPEFISIRLGDEDDFASTWKPAHPRVVVVFNLATTPEAEVQRRLVLDVKRALTAQRAAELLVLLDATSIGNRWSPEKLSGREKLWTEMLQGSGAEIIVAARRGGT